MFFLSGGRLEMGTFLFPWCRGGWSLGVTATTSPAEIDASSASCPYRNYFLLWKFQSFSCDFVQFVCSPVQFVFRLFRYV
jgi:hypothetical protein